MKAFKFTIGLSFFIFVSILYSAQETKASTNLNLNPQFLLELEQKLTNYLDRKVESRFEIIDQKFDNLVTNQSLPSEPQLNLIQLDTLVKLDNVMRDIISLKSTVNFMNETITNIILTQHAKLIELENEILNNAKRQENIEILFQNRTGHNNDNIIRLQELAHNYSKKIDEFSNTAEIFSSKIENMQIHLTNQSENLKSILSSRILDEPAMEIQNTRINPTRRYPGVDTTQQDITKPIELEHIQPVPGSHHDVGKLGTKTMNQEEERIWKDHNEQVEKLERFKEEEITRIQTQNQEHFKQNEQQRAKLQHEHEKILNETEEFKRAQLIKNLPTLPPHGVGVGKQIKECLRAGTKILMEHWNEIEVENLKAGDYVLNHNLKPTRVVGVLKKLLGDNDGFFGLNENGPYFFTKTHIMVGPKNKLYVKDLEALLEENPLMEFLEVEQFNRSGNELYEYSVESKTVSEKFVRVYSDPEPSPPNTWVYIILVDSKDGTYIANNYVTRHELPPLEIWPNTVHCILGLFNDRNEEMRNLLNLPYTLSNMEFLTNEIIDLNLILELEFEKVLTDGCEPTNENSLQYEPQDNIMEELYTNPVLCHLVSELYRVSGKLIANQLDNPIKPINAIQARIMISIIQKLITQSLATK